jgi:outer membrane protein
MSGRDGSKKGGRMNVRPWLALVLMKLLIASDCWGLEPDSPSLITPNKYKWFVNLDLTGVIFDVTSTISVRGSPIPGGAVALSNSVSVSGDLGYFLTPNIAVDLGFGYPPKTAVHGRGALSFLDTGATSRYAPIAALVQYHLNNFASIRPFIGVGPSYSTFFNVQSRSIQSAHIQNAWGIALQAGLDYDLSDSWGLNFDVIRIFSATTADGIVGGIAATAKVHVNPLILRGGVTYRF